MYVVRVTCEIEIEAPAEAVWRVMQTDAGEARKFNALTRFEEIGSHSGGEFLVKW